MIRQRTFALAFIAPGCIAAGFIAALAGAVGCSGGALQDRDASAAGGGAGINISGAAGVAGGGNTAGSRPPPEPCLGESDPRVVVAPQRTVLLTSTELINMIRALVGDTEARAIIDNQIFVVTSDLTRRFPPARTEQIKQIVDSSSMQPFTDVARHAARYVFDNFAVATGCATVTDACVNSYLDAFAEKAYRRPLDAQEQSDLDARYEAARSAGTPQDATRDVVTAILVAPAFLYRSEMGDASNPSLAPPGLPLTPYELASALSFFLTDGPPDQPLLDDARAGTLSATLAAHADRLLATPAARAWLTTLVETLYFLNQLPAVVIDTAPFPEVNPKLLADMQTEAHLFLDDTLWNGSLADLLLSRTTYLNANLATNIYQVPVPPGATATNFVRTTLPADRRSGILTNAGAITTRARATGVNLTARALGVNSWMFSRDIPPIPEALFDGESRAWGLLASQTAQQQVAYRASMPACASCHVHFDPYGVALDSYDVIGRFRTVGDLGKPVDAHATVAPELGGVTVASAIELASVIARSPAFTNGMAKHMLEYGLVDFYLDLPDPAAGVPGCAVADVARRFEAGRAKTFPTLMRAVALSPAFSLRRPAP